MSADETQETVAVLGGTGKEGLGLVYRWASAGIRVLLGSRSMDRADEAARSMNDKVGKQRVQGFLNEQAAERAEVIVSTLPADGQSELLSKVTDSIGNKLFITAAILWPPSPEREISSAEQAKEILGERSRVAAAFQTVSAGTLSSPIGPAGPTGLAGLESITDDADRPHVEDTLVIADSEQTGIEALRWVNLTGIRGVLASTKLSDARTVEAMTGILLKINKRYRVKSTGLRITRLETPVDGV